MYQRLLKLERTGREALALASPTHIFFLSSFLGGQYLTRTCSTSCTRTLFPAVPTYEARVVQAIKQPNGPDLPERVDSSSSS